MPVAIADVTSFAAGDAKSVVLLAPAIATNSAPSSSTAGLATTELFNCFTRWPSVVTLKLYSTAGSGTMTCTARLWGYSPDASGGNWAPIGIGTGALKGTIDAGVSIDETGADKLLHFETFDLPAHFQRLYLEITAIGGTSTSVTAELITRRGF
jgi:hypothetical protein